MKIWKFVFIRSYAERRDTCGGMDSELTGNRIREGVIKFIVAPTEAFARAAFHQALGTSPNGNFEQEPTVSLVGDVMVIAGPLEFRR